MITMQEAHKRMLSDWGSQIDLARHLDVSRQAVSAVLLLGAPCPRIKRGLEDHLGEEVRWMRDKTHRAKKNWSNVLYQRRKRAKGKKGKE